MTVGDVVQRLGGRKVLGAGVASEMALIERVRAGLPVAALDAMVAHLGAVSVPQGEVFDLVGNPRTLQRKRAKQRTSAARTKGAKAAVALSPSESDRLTRLARMVVRAEEVFGSDEKGGRWLATPNRSLDGARPISLLDSDTGALAVERTLGRIEHGVFS